MSPGVPRPQVFRLLCNHLPGLAWRGASNKHGKGDEASSLWLGYKGSGFSLAHPSLPFSPLLTLMDLAAMLGRISFYGLIFCCTTVSFWRLSARMQRHEEIKESVTPIL